MGIWRIPTYRAVGRKPAGEVVTKGRRWQGDEKRPEEPDNRFAPGAFLDYFRFNSIFP